MVAELDDVEDENEDADEGDIDDDKSPLRGAAGGAGLNLTTSRRVDASASTAAAFDFNASSHGNAAVKRQLLLRQRLAATMRDENSVDGATANAAATFPIAYEKLPGAASVSEAEMSRVMRLHTRRLELAARAAAGTASLPQQQQKQ